MKDYQQRVVIEKEELDAKRTKLWNFMVDPEFKVLCDEAERARLMEQAAAMTKYSEILGRRIHAFK